MIKRYLLPQDKEVSRKVFVLALPVIFSNLSRVFMSVVDVAMVGHLGPAALAATGMGAMLFWGALSFMLGIRTAVQTISARRLGQGLFNDCGNAFRNGVVLAFVFAVPLSIVGWGLAGKFVPFFLVDHIATDLAIDYVSVIFLGLLFSSISFVFQGFYTGIEKTRLHMNVTIFSNGLNVYLNAGFIYGSAGIKEFFSDRFPAIEWLHFFWAWTDFPALGVLGAAIATLIASTWMAVHYAFYLFTPAIRNKFKTTRFSLDMVMMKKQINLAWPQGLQEVVVAIGWSFFYKIMGIIGLIELAATELVFTIMHASFMPAIGVGQACATLVSKYMGEKKIDYASNSIIESLRIAEYIMGTMGILFLVIPHFFLTFFTNDPNIITMGAFGLRVLGFLQFVDAIGITLWFALSGAGNTLFPAVVESALVWGVMLPASWYLGVFLDVGFYGPWLVFPFYLIIFALIMVWKIRQGDWKEIEV